MLHFLRHPNIVDLLGSYTYRGEHSLLFPELDMDLADFFREKDRYGTFVDDTRFYSALKGLSSAVESVHSINFSSQKHGFTFAGLGYHHDIRPRNILVSKETFLLADFGLSNMNSAKDGSATLWKNGVGDYIAPECIDANFQHQTIGRAIDIWALGGIICDFIAYLSLSLSSSITLSAHVCQFISAKVLGELNPELEYVEEIGWGRGKLVLAEHIHGERVVHWALKNTKEYRTTFVY